jgi:pimeloyl-ACP methyl ester carboxylesterase
VNTYEAQLTSRLNELGWTIAQYPDVSHRDVARRAIERRRPFDEKGRGYRDTLVWHTVRDVILASETPILLISGDGDFRGPTGQVHKHLAADLDPNGGSEMVTLLQSLPALYEGYIVTVPEWTPRTATRFA